MANYGFVREKLEIKFLILYVMARVIEPLPFEKVLELTMCDDGFGYFDFSDCLAEMVKTGHLSLEDGLYSITDMGRSADEACMTSLAYSVRCKADVNIEAFNKDAKRRMLVKASVTPRPNGTFSVRLSFSDDVSPLMTLELTLVSKQQAEDLCSRFRKDPEGTYMKLISALLTEETT